MVLAINPAYYGMAKSRIRPAKSSATSKTDASRAVSQVKRASYPSRTGAKPAGVPGGVIDKTA